MSEIKKSIYLDSFDKPLSEIVEDVRRELARSRGKLYDIGHSFPIWKSRMNEVEGLLTCGLVALHFYMEEMRDYEKKWPEGEGANPRAALSATPPTTQEAEG